MAITKYNDNTWYSISSRQVCPVCGSKKGRCGVLMNQDNEPVLFRCKYATSSRPSKDGWYIHLAKDVLGTNANTKSNFVNILPTVKKVEITEEILKLRSDVYTRMRELMKKFKGSYIPYEEDKQDLFVRRGQSEKVVEHMGIFSCPRRETITYDGKTMQLKTAIVNKLLESFSAEQLLKVAGFEKKINKNNGSEFITFKSNDGYYIPYKDEKNQIIAMQYRLIKPYIDSKGKPIRYLWLSSEFATSGSPIDYYVPSELKRDDVFVLCEGSLKTKISAEILGYRSLAEGGVGNYRQMVAKLLELEEKENRKFNVILAHDMDKYSNDDVLSAEINALKLLKASGHNVAIAEWDCKTSKGLDDALLNNQKIDYLLV